MFTLAGNASPALGTRLLKRSAVVLLPALAITAMWLLAGISVGKNQPVIASRTIEAQIAVPPNVQTILSRACKDCHSFETRWPWYTRLPVVSDLLRSDVQRARLRMNLSDWTAKRAQGEDEARGTLSGICEELRSDSMPPAQYRWIHRESRLTKKEVEAVCEWTGKVSGTAF